MREEDVTKLPKWAQSKIRVLEMRVRELRAKLAEGPEGADTFADPYADEARPLGKSTRIEFVFDAEKREHIQAHLDEDKHGKYLEVYGNTGLSIEPSASNVLRVRIMDF